MQPLWKVKSPVHSICHLAVYSPHGANMRSHYAESKRLFWKKPRLVVRLPAISHCTNN